ncbi:hypothetical protein QFZ76_009475 [Streptomyces sp. V4I2]|nr:hypothetical protein [Streptomyces sp. V4I2]
MEQEPDPKVKATWELHLNMELEHLRIACDLMRRHDSRDPQEILAPERIRAVAGADPRW